MKASKKKFEGMVLSSNVTLSNLYGKRAGKIAWESDSNFQTALARHSGPDKSGKGSDLNTWYWDAIVKY